MGLTTTINSFAIKPAARPGPVMAIGQLEKEQGFDLRIKSWTCIKQELHIVGSGKENLSLQRLIELLNLSERVKILPENSSPSITAMLKSSSGLVVSSLRAGSPQVILEAISHEIPVLGTNVGIMVGLMPQEFLTEAGNQESLKVLLEEMVPLLPQLDVRALRNSMQERFL